MRVAFAICFIGAALSGALALHGWQPTRAQAVYATCNNSPFATQSPYPDCPADAILDPKNLLGPGQYVNGTAPVAVDYWWQDPAALLTVFAGLALASGIVLIRRPAHA